MCLIKSLLCVSFVVLMAGLLFSCKVNKNIAYFKDLPDSVVRISTGATTFSDPKIQPNDILQVTILTLEPGLNASLNTEGSSVFAVQPSSSSSPSPSQAISGFLVDRTGNIELPVIGKIKVGGLTTSQARDSIHNSVAVFYKNPVVNVRFTNFSITVLGEVARPAAYIVPNEKVNVLDALGMAGDLTIFGKRENVLLIRDSLAKKEFVRLNLNSSDLVKSPYFYLKQGDVLYVEPNKSKAASTDAVKARNYALIASLITVMVTIISRI